MELCYRLTPNAHTISSTLECIICHTTEQQLTAVCWLYLFSILMKSTLCKQQYTQCHENGKWLPILYSAGKRQHSISFVYRSCHLPMPDPSPSTLTVLNSILQLGRSGGWPQRTVYPMRLPVNTVIHTTLVGLEATTFRLLVRRATSSAIALTSFVT